MTRLPFAALLPVVAPAARLLVVAPAARLLVVAPAARLLVVAPAALLLAVALPGCAAEYGDSQACAAPEVLRLVSDRLQRAGLPQRMETRAVGQVPGPRPDVLLCAVWVHSVVYDTPVVGSAPLDRLVAYNYQVQLRRNAAFLLP